MPRKNSYSIYALLLLIVFACKTERKEVATRDIPFFSNPVKLVIPTGQEVTAERGNIIVPSDRSADSTSYITIEYYRFKGAEGTEGNAPIFRLYGGPDFENLQQRWTNPDYYPLEVEPYLAMGDFVIVGQRGIGTSYPDTECYTIDVGNSPESRAEAIEENSKACKEYWLGQGVDLQGLNIIEAAKDVDEVRQALGYDKIKLWGVSFGSHWSMAVMRYHPEIVERAMLVGLEGPNHTYDVPGEVFNGLERMAAAADQSPRLQGLTPEGGLINAYKAVVERLEKEPVVVEVNTVDGLQKVTVDADMVRDFALGYTGRVSTRKNMAYWPADILRLYRGDYTALAAKAYESRKYDSMPTASFYMLDCASGITPEKLEKIQNDPAHRWIGNVVDEYVAACPVWDTDLGDDFRQNFDTEIPTLLIHGYWDTSTPYENALELAPFFKNSKLVTVVGGPHFTLVECMKDAKPFVEEVKEFLASGDFDDIPEEVVLPEIEWKIPEQGM